jgi:hypothetical protein
LSDILTSNCWVLCSGLVRHINVELLATKGRDQLVVPTWTPWLLRFASLC